MSDPAGPTAAVSAILSKMPSCTHGEPHTECPPQRTRYHHDACAATRQPLRPADRQTGCSMLRGRNKYHSVSPHCRIRARHCGPDPDTVGAELPGPFRRLYHLRHALGIGFWPQRLALHTVRVWTPAGGYPPSNGMPGGGRVHRHDRVAPVLGHCGTRLRSERHSVQFARRRHRNRRGRVPAAAPRTLGVRGDPVIDCLARWDAARLPPASSGLSPFHSRTAFTTSKSHRSSASSPRFAAR